MVRNGSGVFVLMKVRVGLLLELALFGLEQAQFTNLRIDLLDLAHLNLLTVGRSDRLLSILKPNGADLLIFQLRMRYLQEKLGYGVLISSSS